MPTEEMLELAVWLDGRESEQEIAHWKTVVCPESLYEVAERLNLEVGPITFTIKQIGDDRVPVPPPHIVGPDIRLLVAEAKVVPVRRIVLKETGFVADLDKEDRDKLRAITRKAHAKRVPGDRLSNRHCDQIIEALGPETAVKTLMDGQDGRSIN